MEIHLTEDLKQFVQGAVHAGLYAGEDDVIRDALTRLQQSIPPATDASDRKSKATRRVEPPIPQVTPEDLNRRLLASGLVLQLPDPAQDLDEEDDPPVEIQGESLSETIIRERR